MLTKIFTYHLYKLLTFLFCLVLLYNVLMAIKYHYVDSPLYKLECTAKACERHFAKLFKRKFSNLDITHGEFCVIDTIVRTPEISQIELARLLCKGRAHITLILSSIENKGFIKRSNEIKNGRQIRITALTEKGQQIYNTICTELDKNFKNMTTFFDGKEEKLISYLEEIQEIITNGDKVTFD